MNYTIISAKTALFVLMLMLTPAQAITTFQSEPSFTGSVSWINAANYLVSIDNQAFTISKDVSQKSLQKIEAGESVRYLLKNNKTIKSIWIENTPETN